MAIAPPGMGGQEETTPSITSATNAATAGVPGELGPPRRHFGGRGGALGHKDGQKQGASFVPRERGEGEREEGEGEAEGETRKMEGDASDKTARAAWPVLPLDWREEKEKE